MIRAEIIARKRRQQPLSELERKARKAGRRRRNSRGGIGFSEEAKDFGFAKDHIQSLSFRSEWLRDLGAPQNYCRLCAQFGRDWDDATKRYRVPVQHDARCTLNPVAPEVYAGTIFTGAIAGPVGRLP
jgi:hypothetical protein